jgi:hypothetical protein
MPGREALRDQDPPDSVALALTGPEERPSRRGGSGPGERDDLEPDGPVVVPGHVESLFAAFWVAWQGPISKPDPCRFSRDIDEHGRDAVVVVTLAEDRPSGGPTSS